MEQTEANVVELKTYPQLGVYMIFAYDHGSST